MMQWIEKDSNLIIAILFEVVALFMLGCKKSLNSYSTDVMLTTRSITIVKTPAQKSCFAENFHKRKRKSLKPVFCDVFFVYCSTNVMKNKGIKAHKLR